MKYIFLGMRLYRNLFRRDAYSIICEARLTPLLEKYSTKRANAQIDLRLKKNQFEYLKDQGHPFSSPLV